MGRLAKELVDKREGCGVTKIMRKVCGKGKGKKRGDSCF